MRYASFGLIVIVARIAFCQEPAAPLAPPKPWTGSAGAGLALTSGNTDTQSYNLSATAKYDPQTRFVFKAEGLYLRGSANGEKQVDKATASGRGEFAVSERTFAFGEVSYLRDPFKAISYLVAPVVGGGYRILKSEQRNLSVDAAVGAQFESNEVVGRSTSAVVKAGQNFDWTLSPTSKITQALTGIWKTSDFGDALYHFDAGIAATIARRTELKVAYLYDYKSKPIPENLKKGDSALFAALLFKF